MNEEMQILNIDGTPYEIVDGKARQDITTIKGKQVVTNVTLKQSYTQETKH